MKIGMMETGVRFFCLALGLALIFSASVSSAQTPTPTASPDKVRVCPLNDLTLTPAWSGSGDKTGSSGIIVYYNNGSNYYVTVNTLESAFVAKAASVTPIPFEVRWNDGTGDSDPLTAGSRYSMRNASSTDAACAGSANATVKIKFSENDLQHAVAATYGTTLTVAVEPAS